jgi:predicted metal-dependent hydrolase
MAMRERKANGPRVRDNVLPAPRQRSVVVGKHIHHSAPLKARVLLAQCQHREADLSAAVYRHRGDALSLAVRQPREVDLYRCHALQEQAGREVAHALAVQQLAGRAIREQDNAQLQGRGRAQVVPALRGAAMGVQQDAAVHRRKERRNGGHRSSKRSQPALLLFHHKFW